MHRGDPGMIALNKRPDPVTLGSAVLVLGASAVLATYLPARKATRADPVTSLRAE